MPRNRIRIKIPVTQTIEYKIYCLKKELGKQEKTLQYQVFSLENGNQFP